MKFIMQQIAICPPDPVAALELLTALGARDWIQDQVRAEGSVYDEPGRNVADLLFNYTLAPAPVEFELLHYVDGPNWMDEMLRTGSVSHLGMHCTERELEEFKAFFNKRGINIAQEVFTSQHTNPVIAGKRKYHYTIFDTRKILGVDLKFIVRIEERP